MKNLEEEPSLEPIYYLALDGNVKAALDKLISLDPRILTAKEKKLRTKFLQRFGRDTLSPHLAGEELVDELISIYQSYWHRVLLQRLNKEEGHAYLFEQLSPLVKRLGGSIGPFSEAEYERVGEYLKRKLEIDGVFAMIGDVSPHLTFMAWKREKTEAYTVNLGDGVTETVNVVLMEDFLSLGWSAYATLEKLHVGGWVGEKSLHCVASCYDLKSEKFKVSFLAHEARHFADKNKYPKLKSLDLEYRARLNELMLAELSLKDLLKKFILEQKENPANSHSYASFLMLKGFAKKLRRPISLPNIRFVSQGQVHRYAAEMLKENTDKLEKEDPGQVESVLS